MRKVIFVSEMRLLELIYHGREERNLEYKSSMSWDDITTKTKVLKSCLAMANIPYGGYLVFGVEEIGEGIFEQKGMTIDDANSFNQDDVSDYINKFADPYIELKVDPVEDNGKKFIVIQIKEFNEIPVICKKDGDKGIIKGAIYTRPIKKFESVLVPSQTELREIIDLALDKQLRKLVERISRLGIKLSEAKRISDSEKFNEQLGGL